MTAQSKQKQFFGLVAWIIVSFVAAAIGAAASIQAQSFYGQMTQPAWAPPGSVFGPVWTVLYAMMAIAAWRVWCSGGFRSNRAALSVFLLQLVLNALWSWLFFAWHLGAVALFDIAIFWLLIATTLVAFWRVSKIAGILLVPYLLWVSFAMALNYAVWQLNPQLLA